MEQDKHLHVLYGAIVASFAAPFGFLYMLLAGVVVAAVKEWIYDTTMNFMAGRKGLPARNTSDPADFRATVLGAVLYSVMHVAWMNILTWALL